MHFISSSSPPSSLFSLFVDQLRCASTILRNVTQSLSGRSFFCKDFSQFMPTANLEGWLQLVPPFPFVSLCQHLPKSPFPLRFFKLSAGRGQFAYLSWPGYSWLSFLHLFTFVFCWNNNGSSEGGKHGLFLQNEAVGRVEAPQKDLEHVLRRQGSRSTHSK